MDGRWRRRPKCGHSQKIYILPHTLTHILTHMYIYKQKRAKQKGASHLGHLQCVTCCIFNGSCGCWEQGVTNHLQNLRYFLVEDIYLQVCVFVIERVIHMFLAS